MIRYSLSWLLSDTHAYVSVLSAQGSLRTARASRWLDPNSAPPATANSAAVVKLRGNSFMFTLLDVYTKGGRFWMDGRRVLAYDEPGETGGLVSNAACCSRD